MCYDDNARPPVPQTGGGAAHGEDIILTAVDGNRFSAYVAHPAQPKNAQIVIYPDVRGLHQFYKDLALRFAEMGISAVAIDYFGRTAGLTGRDDSFDFWPHVQQMQIKNLVADVNAAFEQLHANGGKERATFIVGFCMGGSLSLLTATEDFGLAGVIPFYAGLSRAFAGTGTVLEQATKVKYPVLGLFGGADQGIPPEQVQELDQKLGTAGVEHEIISYPGAPHSFFDRRAVDFADASADAWKRIEKFITAHSA
ncbi:MAG: dienelactone hydrolase family protein [Ktedonobacteraceae bacterium]